MLARVLIEYENDIDKYLLRESIEIAYLSDQDLNFKFNFTLITYIYKMDVKIINTHN